MFFAVENLCSGISCIINDAQAARRATGDRARSVRALESALRLQLWPVFPLVWPRVPGTPPRAPRLSQPVLWEDTQQYGCVWGLVHSAETRLQPRASDALAPGWCLGNWLCCSHPVPGDSEAGSAQVTSGKNSLTVSQGQSRGEKSLRINYSNRSLSREGRVPGPGLDRVVS